MKKETILAIFLLLLVFTSGCQTGTTGKVTTSVCDDLCQKEKDDYITSVNNLLVQAQTITARVSDWKSVTKKDLEDITSLRDQVSVLKAPQDFELVHDYYSRAFNHYVEAVAHAVTANEKYKSSSDSLDMQLRNKALTSVIDNAQEANRLLIYADEEAKFATHIVAKV